MYYITLARSFWALNSIQIFSNAETKLFFFLLEEANRLRWPKKFSISTTIMQGRIGMSRSAICKAREALKVRGLIQYTKGDHLYQKAEYSFIIPASVPCQTDTDAIIVNDDKSALNSSQSSMPQESTSHCTQECTQESTPASTQETTIIKTEERKQKEKPSKEGKKNSHALSSFVDLKRKYREEGDEVYAKFADWLALNAPYIDSHLQPVSPPQLQRLLQNFSAQCVSDVCLKIENRKDLRSHYSNLYQTLINWCKNENR